MRKKITKATVFILSLTIFMLVYNRIELFDFHSTSISSLKLNVIIYGIALAIILISYLIFRLKSLEHNNII
jgi:hypothetical protein